jgi:hypothetical protein
MVEYIYCAKKIGDEDWMETVVRESRVKLSDEDLAILKEELAALGMEFVRMWEYRGEAPNFAGAVRKF